MIRLLTYPIGALLAILIFLTPATQAQSPVSGLHVFVSQAEPFVAGEEGAYSIAVLNLGANRITGEVVVTHQLAGAQTLVQAAGEEELAIGTEQGFQLWSALGTLHQGAGLLLKDVTNSRVGGCLIRDDRPGAQSVSVRAGGGRGNVIAGNMLGRPADIAASVGVVERNH